MNKTKQFLVAAGGGILFGLIGTLYELPFAVIGPAAFLFGLFAPRAIFPDAPPID